MRFSGWEEWLTCSLRWYSWLSSSKLVKYSIFSDRSRRGTRRNAPQTADSFFVVGRSNWVRPPYRDSHRGGWFVWARHVGSKISRSWMDLAYPGCADVPGRLCCRHLSLSAHCAATQATRGVDVHSGPAAVLRNADSLVITALKINQPSQLDSIRSLTAPVAGHQ